VVFVVLESKEELEAYRDEIRELLQATDKDFWPPLSARKINAPPVDGGGDRRRQKPDAALDAFVDELMSQTVMLALVDGKAVSMLSYRQNYVPHGLQNGTWGPVLGDDPMTYVTTIATHPDFREQGFTRQLFDMLDELVDGPIGARTWGQNNGSRKAFGSRGFIEAAVIENDRPPMPNGDVVDSIYFYRATLEQGLRAREGKVSDVIEQVSGDMTPRQHSDILMGRDSFDLAR
jgi:hypothetical protein